MEYKDDLLDAVWLGLTSDLPGNGALLEVVDGTPVSRRFYRIRVRLP